MSESFFLRYMGDPVLRLPAVDVAPDTDIRRLVNAMQGILETEHGLGLAAQQVGSTERVALMRLGNTVVVAINLRIIARSKDVAVSVQEGCLSVQRAGQFFRTNIRRHKSVTIVYLDEQRTEHTVRLQGLDATVAQHECDHLDGRCIVDGLSRQQRRQAERLVGRRAREEGPRSEAQSV